MINPRDLAGDRRRRRRFSWGFCGLSHTSELKIGTPVATLPGAWRYRVSAGEDLTRADHVCWSMIWSWGRPHALIQALQSSNLGSGWGNGNKAIPLYFSGHRSPERHWSKQQWPASPFILPSVTVCPALFMLCCCSACQAVFPSLRVPHAFRHVPRAFRHVPRAFRHVPRAFLRVPHAFLHVPRAFRHVPHAFLRVPRAFCSKRRTRCRGTVIDRYRACVSLYPPSVWWSVCNVSALGVGGPSSSQSRVIPEHMRMAFWWIARQTPGVVGSVWGLVGPMSEWCNCSE